MSSFYGGKQGRTYNIVQRYNSVQQMCEAFAGGGAYTDANYGQYVIIDTVLSDGRSNRQNGLLYRRGFDYNQTIQSVPVKQNTQTDEQFKVRWNEYIQHPGAGAIYVGQIVGPEGRTPEVTIEQWSAFQAQSTASGTGAFGSTSSIVLEQSTTGKTDDQIKVGYVNIRDVHGDTTGGYIAIDIPKHVQQAEVVNHGPYATAGVVETPASTAHPLWYKWDFTIPDGKHGSDVHDIKIEEGSQTGEEQDGFGNPIVSGDKYFTYSVQDYNTRGEDDYHAAEVITGHLGRWPYRVIDGITLINDDRTIINWQNGQEVKVGDLYQKNLDPSAENYDDIKNLYWVCIKAGHIVEDDNIGHDSYFMPDLTSLDQVGLVVNNLQETAWRVINIPQTAPAHSIIVSYAAGADDQFEKVLRNVDHLSVDQLGNLYAFYSDDIDQSYYLTNIGGLKTGSGDQDKGVIVTDDSIKFIYTNGTVLTYPLKQILSVDFYTGTPQRDEQTNQWKYDEQGKLVFDSYDQDSNLKIRYKDGNYNTFEVKRINRIVYNNSNLNASQHIRVQYLGGQQTNVTEVPVNMVSAIGRQGDNILVLYSDPGVREQIPQDKQIVVPSWTDPSTGTSYNNLVWYNFGPLGAQYHIQGEYNIADLKGDTTDPDFTIDLSEGFKGDLEDRMGWLVTLTDENDNKRLYAFDYNDDLENPSHELYDGTSSCWYEIMELSATMINPDRVVAISPASTTPTTLVDNGLWFVVSYGHDENI